MIYVCTLTSGVINANTHYDLTAMLRTYTNYIHAVVVGSYIQTLREGCANAIRSTDATHLAFIDSDMEFPTDAIEQLKKRNKDIIGANYVNRVEQELWTASLNNENVVSKEKRGIQRVDEMGMGVALIKTDVFRKLPQPWFCMEWKDNHYEGEDTHFCRLARKYGYDIWVDHDLSQQVYHIGTIKLGVDNYMLPEYFIPDIDGWMLPNEMKFLYEQAKQMNTIVELGSWKGRSTHALASGCKGRVWAIDHWKGSINTPLEEIAKSEDIYAEFSRNISKFRNVTVLKMTTDEASIKFEDKSVDMVFIDAGHSYAEVINDIDKWLPKTKRLLCGHDYTSEFPEVIRAVNDRFGKPDAILGSIWLKAV